MERERTREQRGSRKRNLSRVLWWCLGSRYELCGSFRRVFPGDWYIRPHGCLMGTQPGHIRMAGSREVRTNRWNLILGRYGSPVGYSERSFIGRTDSDNFAL